MAVESDIAPEGNGLRLVLSTKWIKQTAQGKGFGTYKRLLQAYRTWHQSLCQRCRSKYTQHYEQGYFPRNTPRVGEQAPKVRNVSDK